jgi:3-oxoacyl-(acyl-carrier-protein) synthase
MVHFLEKEGIACSPISRFCTKAFKTKLAFQIDQEAFARLDHTNLALPLIVRYGRHALAEALDMARLDFNHVVPICVYGTTVAGAWEMEAAYGSLNKYAQEYRPVWHASEAISFTHPCEAIFHVIPVGELQVLSTGCTAGLDALGVAWMQILEGADCAIALTAEIGITPLVVTSFEQINALTRETTWPECASQPFSFDRSGFCLAEGAAVIILEEERHARVRNAAILGSLRSYATTSSAYHMTGIHPSGEDIARSFVFALEAAAVDPKDIALFSLHATSTPQNDAAEHAAICQLFDTSEPRQVPIFAGKANFGHALASSNLIETVATIKILHRMVTPPYPHLRRRNIEFNDLFLPDRATRLNGNLAIKNSSGFSGIHSAVVLEGPSWT